HDHQSEVLRALENRTADGLEVRREDHVHAAARGDQLVFRVGLPRRRVEGPADDDLVAGRAEWIEILGSTARTRRPELPGLLHITLTSSSPLSPLPAD